MSLLLGVSAQFAICNCAKTHQADPCSFQDYADRAPAQHPQRPEADVK